MRGVGTLEGVRDRAFRIRGIDAAEHHPATGMWHCLHKCDDHIANNVAAGLIGKLLCDAVVAPAGRDESEGAIVTFDVVVRDEQAAIAHDERRLHAAGNQSHALMS